MANSDSRRRPLAAIALVTGTVLGIAGAPAPSADLRVLGWGVDGELHRSLAPKVGRVRI